MVPPTMAPVREVALADAKMAGEVVAAGLATTVEEEVEEDEELEEDDELLVVELRLVTVPSVVGSVSLLMLCVYAILTAGRVRAVVTPLAVAITTVA